MVNEVSISIADNEPEILETRRRRLLLEGTSADLCTNPIGAIGYFVKPFQDIDLVAESIAHVLRWREAIATKTAGAH